MPCLANWPEQEVSVVPFVGCQSVSTEQVVRGVFGAHLPGICACQDIQQEIYRPGGRVAAEASLCSFVHSLNIYIVRVLSVHIIPGCVQAKSGSAGVTCLASGPRPGLVSGSREGIITSWAVDSGTTLQTIDISQVQPASKLAPPAKGGPSVF